MRTTLLHGVLAGRVRRAVPDRAWALRLPVVLAVSVALTIPLGLVQVAHAEPGGLGRLDVPGYRAGKVSAVHGLGAAVARAHVKSERTAQKKAATRAIAEQIARWPAAGTDTGTLSSGSSVRLAVGGLPVTLSSPDARKGADKAAAGQVRVRSLGQKAAEAAGIKGVLFEATATTPGTARLDVDYGKFASALGGGWSSRLRLVRLPSCVLTRPQDADCREAVPVEDSHNDVVAQTLTADVSLDATPLTSTQASAAPSVFAATASTSNGESPSGAGNFAATPLSASSAWTAGGSSGSFTWSYDLTMPPAAAGPVPGVGLSYDSASVDGKTATTNNQSTQLGEGFTLSSDAYVSRSYGSCDDDGQDGKYDQCWKYENASLVLNGHSSELVKDDTTGQWHLKDDDASVVTHSTGADNGDQGDTGVDGAGEYWTVTTGDGTKYVFGLNKLPGAGSQRTNSVWTVPVFGDDSGEPGNPDGSSFVGRALNQAWRWNLDYVVDVHGNAATYWYTPETNYYAKNGATTGTASYTRAGHLDKIRYGQRSDTLFTADASDEVRFTYAERCFTDCTALTKDTAGHWPDVPFDSVCASGADCDATSPSFFTRKRLTSVETFAWLASSSTYDNVDKWDFTEEFLDPGDIGDTSDQSLVLGKIVRTGEGGTDSTALKPVSFTYRPLANRVDATDDIMPLSRYRIDTITSETGAITTVTLAAADCVRGSDMPAAEDDNGKACFPQYWHVNGAENASLDWFQKYPVETVVTDDPTGLGEGLESSYSYADPGWAHNDAPFTPSDERTWSDFRGYGKVTVTTGAAGTTQSKTVSLFMRGMNGDKLEGTTATRTASTAGIDVPGLDVPDISDAKQYAGFAREQITYDGATPIAVAVSDPWSKKTATQHKSYADIEAYYVRTAETATHTYLTVPQTWRTRTVSTTYDAYGMTAAVADAGDAAKSGDETCTRNWYARNTAAGLTSLLSRTRTVARPCSVADADLDLPATTADRGDVLSDAATVYDDTAATAWTPDQTPTKGEATWAGRPTGYPATATGDERNPTGWQTVGRATFDDSTSSALGRPVSGQDAEGHITTTTYVPASSGPTTQITVTNPEGQAVVTNLDPERGSTVKTTGVDGKATESTQDALGRVTAVWLPNRRRILHQTANYVYAYHPDNAAPSWESTGTLEADGTTYNTAYTIYDSLLRTLQTQTPTPNGGRLLTDTRYDTRGLAYETYADIFDHDTTPTGTYARAEYGGAPKQTETVYDGAGRPTTSTLLVFRVPKWSTTTTYTGDSTATTALDGGSAVRTITDALGRTTQQRNYAGTSPADTQYGAGVGTPYTTTDYTYTADGKPVTVTGPDAAQWSYIYDLYGRQTRAVDPDAGTTTTGYTDLDQVAWTKDAAGRAVVSAYDELGRVTGTWSAPAGADLTSTAEEQVPANQLTASTYDTLVAGQPTSSTRYVGGSGPSGKAYTSKVTEYDPLNRATSTELDLPADDPLVTSGAVTSALASTTYYRIDGTQANVTTPAGGGLASEKVATGYDSLGLPTTLRGTSAYVNDVSYSPLGQVSQLALGTDEAAGIKHVFVANTYEDGTDHLIKSVVTDQTHPYKLQELNYGYDDAGNVTHVFDPTTLGGTGAADNQCFAYDGYDRLTDAWTPTAADCSIANRTTANLGGAGPYWTSYTYTASGLRTTQTDHTTAGSTLQTYCYDDAAHPHALTAVVPLVSCAGAPTQYTYDAAGKTKTRPQGGSTEALGWNTEGRLDSATVPDGTTTDTTDYLYDASGNLLIRREADGETVLYLDGITEVHLQQTGTTSTYWAQRTYTLGGTAVAVRTNQPGQPALTWLAGDHHGTSTLAVNDEGQATTKRYTTPFGAPRTGGTGTWPDDKGFLGKPRDDTTGLTHVGAREYDPTTGRFISLDPLLDTTDPQSLNGYTYADNNPQTFSDPTGLRPSDCAEPGFSCGSDSITDPEGKTLPIRNPASAGSGSGSGAGAALPGRYGNKTSRHDEAQARAIIAIKAQLRILGITNYTITSNTQIRGAAKKCLYGGMQPGDPGCSYGKPDILLFDKTNDVYYVWEVKSASKAYQAVKEANWYVKAIRHNGDKAVLGWTIGGPYNVKNGDKVIGPESGAVIYGRVSKERKFRKILTNNPVSVWTQQSANIPHPVPGPAPGMYPGTVDQPGLGTIPLGSGGGSMADLIVPFIVFGAPLAAAAAPEEAAGATTVGAADLVANLFGLAA
jgi:RHS repeat-associated protein